MGDVNSYFQIYTSDYFTQYIYCFHVAVVLITGNDVCPRNELQVALASFATFSGAIVNANIFGELAVLIT